MTNKTIVKFCHFSYFLTFFKFQFLNIKIVPALPSHFAWDPESDSWTDPSVNQKLKNFLFFSSLTIPQNKLVRLFLTSIFRLFLYLQTVMSKVRCSTWVCSHLFANIRLTWKCLPGTNATAYFARAALSKEKKCFITLKPGMVSSLVWLGFSFLIDSWL